MANWATIIRAMAPRAKKSIVDGLVAAMPRIVSIANLSTPLRQAHFFAQLAHESAGFTTTEEFASGAAYEGRRDLGNTKRGDGRRFKGRGLIQLTGRHNYRVYGEKLGVDFISDPKLAGDFPWAALTAAVYWRDRGLNRYADRDDIRTLTRHINGGYNGLADRERYLRLARRAINDVPSAAPIPVKSAQKRLAELNYALGAIDGQIGPLTRSAIRDFQDAIGETVTGELDQRTYALLVSSDALPRPVSADREQMTIKELKAAGSEVIEAADAVKANIATAGSALAGASAIATQVNDINGHVTNVKAAIEAGHASASWIVENWQVFAIGALLVVVAISAWQVWRYANAVEEARLKDARTGVNVKR